MRAPLAKRLHAETRFRLAGRAALILSVALLFVLLGSLLWRGLPGFVQVQVKLPVTLDMQPLEIDNPAQLKTLSPARFTPLLRESLKKRFPQAQGLAQRREIYALVSGNAAGRAIKERMLDPNMRGKTAYLWLPAGAALDHDYKRGRADSPYTRELAEAGDIRTVFNTGFFTGGDSRSPEQAGFLGAAAGSLWMLAVCLAAAFPLGVATAVYLQEFATPGRLVDIIEVNINNLAAVPSIVFGLLGLAVYLNTLGLPRGSALAGGLTLSLMILPVIIITTRSALAAVPDSIRHAALALGASPLQVVVHHTLPLALPGIMTGAILGIARAMGETAPLLMIGMVAFVADIPRGPVDPATAMPVQIYLWAASPEAGFAEKTAAGIVVLLAILAVLNASAIVIRRRFEVRW